jgi:integrase
MHAISEVPRDLASLVVPRVGALRETADYLEPWEVLDEDGVRRAEVSVFFRDLRAAGRQPSTLRSYGADLLRWFRFLSAIDVRWDQATRVEARDFCCWLGMTSKPRKRGRPFTAVNEVTGRPSPGEHYADSTRAHTETALRHFYDIHLDFGTGPIINPFPLDRSRRGGRANAHGNPLAPFDHARVGLYRPRVVTTAPKAIPDEWFNQLFARLPSDRDRAMVAFWVSTGARASELLGLRQGDVDPGEQLIGVIRKGTREFQRLPASPDSFVWLRLYQEGLGKHVPRGKGKPVWWTIRGEARPLTYHAAYRMFERVNTMLGSNWTLHDLRHTAAHRMARDPDMPITDVQWVLGHRYLSTTQIYVNPTTEEVITSVRAFHARQGQAKRAAAPSAADEYNKASLATLFAGRPL